VGLVDLFELVFVAFVDVGVVSLCQRVVGVFDLFHAGFLVDAEDLVVVFV
jgi:hypothetical protein